jgi:hypothetical protein
MDVFVQNDNVNVISNIIYNHNIVTTIKRVSVYFPTVLHMRKYISSVGNKQYVLEFVFYLMK